MYSGVVPQQPPTMFSQPLRANSPMRLGHVFGGVVEVAEAVGHAGVGMAVEEAGGEAGEGFEIRAHVTGAEGTVDADAQEIEMRDGVPEGLDGLAGEGAAGLVDDGGGDHDREAGAGAVEVLVDGEQACFHVEGVEAGLGQQQVDTAFDEALDLFGVGADEVIEGDGAVAGVVDLGGEGGGLVGGADAAGDEPGLVGVQFGDGRRPLDGRSAAAARFISTQRSWRP